MRQGTVLQTVVPHTPNPGTVSRVTNASLSTALQAGHSLRHLCAGISLRSVRSEISLEGCTQLETDLWRDVPSGQGGAGSAWKAVLSEAVVTGGEALGKV